MKKKLLLPFQSFFSTHQNIDDSLSTQDKLELIAIEYHYASVSDLVADVWKFMVHNPDRIVEN